MQILKIKYICIISDTMSSEKRIRKPPLKFQSWEEGDKHPPMAIRKQLKKESKKQEKVKAYQKVYRENMSKEKKKVYNKTHNQKLKLGSKYKVVDDKKQSASKTKK